MCALFEVHRQLLVVFQFSLSRLSAVLWLLGTEKTFLRTFRILAPRAGGDTTQQGLLFLFVKALATLFF